MSKNLSIAYAMSKRPKKMADGGPVIDPDKAKQFIKGFTSVREHDECPSCGYAKGGEVGSYDHSNQQEGVNRVLPRFDRSSSQVKHGESHMGKSVRHGDMEGAKKVAYATIKEGRNVAKGKSHRPLEGLSDGGLVDRIMAKRMSEGGVASNEQELHADELPNEFDDLVLDDNLEADYAGSEELGDEQESEDRHDIVSKILASRRKKDKNPRPA